LEQLDLRVIRFSNADVLHVLHRVDWVIYQITEAVKSGQRDSEPSGSPL
jgi:hypothetical protein